VPDLLPFVAEQPLVDHHCHGVLRAELNVVGFEALLSEGLAYNTTGGPAGVTPFDSLVGFAFRRWCPPVLGMEPHATPADYLRRRAGLGAGEVNQRFLKDAGLAALCVDSGFQPDSLLSPAEMGEAAGVPAHEIIRLEQIAEATAAGGVSAADFAGAVRAALAEQARGAVAVKSIAAYRVGLELSGEPPTEAEVAAAAGPWLASVSEGPIRLADETLHRFLIWCGVDLGLPIQFHVGYGDRDIDLHRCNPLLLTGLLRAIEPLGVPVVLLHNYPYHREAGYLAQVFPHVYVDAGLATHNVGSRASALIAEALELTHFGKFLYSSDAFGLPELYYLGALLFRRALSDFLRAGLDGGEWTEHDAERVTRMTGAENARRVYRIGVLPSARPHHADHHHTSPHHTSPSPSAPSPACPFHGLPPPRLP